MPAILAGALCTLLVNMLVRLTASVDPFYCCCCPIEVVPLGVLPAVLMLRRDPALTPGQGFAVSFIANGLGSIVVAINDLLRLDAQAQANLRGEFRRMLEEGNRAREPKLTAEQIDDAIAGVAAIQPYLPIVVALVFTVLAGMCGLFAVGVLRRRRRVVPPPPPQTPLAPPPSPTPPVANG